MPLTIFEANYHDDASIYNCPECGFREIAYSPRICPDCKRGAEQGPRSAVGSPDGSLGGERDATAGGVDVSICKICGKNKKLLNGWCHDCWDKYLAEELG